MPRPRVSIELLSKETCGGQESLLLVRLLQGNLPWSVTLRLPDGSLKEMSGLTDRTYAYHTSQVPRNLVVVTVAGIRAHVQ